MLRSAKKKQGTTRSNGPSSEHSTASNGCPLPVSESERFSRKRRHEHFGGRRSKANNSSAPNACQVNNFLVHPHCAQQIFFIIFPFRLVSVFSIKKYSECGREEAKEAELAKPGLSSKKLSCVFFVFYQKTFFLNYAFPTNLDDIQLSI